MLSNINFGSCYLSLMLSFYEMNAKYETHSQTSENPSASVKQKKRKTIAICTRSFVLVMFVHIKFHYSNYIGIVGGSAVLGRAKEWSFFWLLLNKLTEFKWKCTRNWNSKVKQNKIHEETNTNTFRYVCLLDTKDPASYE